MEKCPVELQILILSYACTDDGSTGRTLSLVSRAFRELSYPFQWSSLALYGYTRVAAFSRWLYSQPPTVGPPSRPILHLLISTRPAELAFDYVCVEAPPTWPGVLRSILRYAAPTLQTLSVVSFEAPVNCAAILSQALHINYPSLIELTIRGRCTPNQLSQPSSFFVEHNNSEDAIHDVRTVDGSDGVTRGATWPPIPTLRRLHLALTFQGMERGTKAEHALITDLAPFVTHLRFSVLDLWGCKRIADIVHAEYAESGIVCPSIMVQFPHTSPPPPLLPDGLPIPPETHHESRRLSLPRLSHTSFRTTPSPEATPRKAIRVTWARIIPPSDTFQQFVLQPPPTEMSKFYCSCCMDARGDSDVMRVFEALARASDKRFLYLPLRTRSVYGFQEATMDWLERIDGRQGCWAAREQNFGRQIAEDAAVHPAAGEERERGQSDRLAGPNSGDHNIGLVHVIEGSRLD
ncbi:hypothetical protein BC628DRAFT_223278 [Trametes gibbosa]|nr:hypothetical protein BC628DRAFT_223278 [Trametes gibbosa]